MKREVPGHCPICGGETKVTEIHCRKCDTTIQGKFDLCKFCKFTEQQKYFVEVFIKNRGNIKEIEKELGISYPTVRNKLDEVIHALGHKVEKQTVNQKEILEKLSKGEISKNEALKLLKE
ncbi:Protein of unknown function DUF2089 [Methanobacterium lacus]|jgi:hypothetical protein|uniref:DUF2089 domain-containing protein n=1 Tax=Methanobacterium lacus (strain AL-21) TaxID=877455 RepID=F0T8E9_METLA|nr:DUF2089 domain-containing protein [Methanobacterium lacus]ADZ09700.1 Protein of unknown function DUF2089 [Methanobacterium lacus]